jgi:hypothetical protein
MIPVKIFGPLADADWQMLFCVVDVNTRQADVVEVIATAHPAGGFAGGLHRRQQQGHEDADDRDDDE